MQALISGGLAGGLFFVHPQFIRMTCPVCCSPYLTSMGTSLVTNGEYPFCKLVHYYRKDPRFQTSFPVNALPDITTMHLAVTTLSTRRGAG